MGTGPITWGCSNFEVGSISMKRIFLIHLVILCCANVFAQTATIVKVRSGYQGFPFIILPDSTISKKINDCLQIGSIGSITSRAALPKLLKESGDDGYTQIGNTLSYEVYANNDKYLSLKISTTPGTTMEPPTFSSYAFNVQNGELILLTDLIDSASLPVLKKMLADKRRLVISKRLRSEE